MFPSGRAAQEESRMPDPVRLLLIEDSEDDAELIRLELRRGGLDLDWRRVQSEGELVEALQHEWDVIVSDFQMPSFNGLRAFALYREAGLDTPFIFVSGALGEERAVEAMRAGARDYLLKSNLARLGVAVRRELAAAADRDAQRRAEEATVRERQRLTVAVEASGAGVFEHSVPPDGRSYHNERWAEILGLGNEDLAPPEAVAQQLLERVQPEDRDGLRAAYLAFIEGRTERLHVEAQVRHTAGHWVDVDVSAHAVERDASGRAMHVVGVMLDLTERRRLEAQFRQAQKMEAIGRLAGGVAHDFNNLLTVIITSGEFVLEALDENHPVRDDVQEVLKTAARAGVLTEQLLAFSRSKPVSPRVVNVNEIVQDVEGLMRRMVGKDVDLTTRLASDLWNVRIDRGSLEQVLANLAVNARDAMPQGGRLTIETSNAEVADILRTEGADVPPGRYVVVAVSDDGLGMDEGVRRRIFEPFFTTKGPRKGTGLGLSTCYGIIRQAEGFIDVQTELVLVSMLFI
jgi:PAS domain S-box-containing protein